MKTDQRRSLPRGAWSSFLVFVRAQLKRAGSDREEGSARTTDASMREGFRPSIFDVSHQNNDLRSEDRGKNMNFSQLKAVVPQ
jgi:hypothetical protein